MNEFDVWKVAFDPSDPDTIFAGTRPAALFRSTDGGRQWRQLPVDMVEECPNVGVPRITALTVDPSDRRIVWAGVEVDGVRRSLDGGETWSRIAGGLHDPDIHDVAVRVKNGDKCVLTSTPREIFCSTDKGESWQGSASASRSALPYCRHLAMKADDPEPSSSPPAMPRSARRARSSARRMAARPGRCCPCRSSRTRRSGRLRRIRPTPASFSRAAITANSTAAATPAIRGPNCAANSPRPVPWPGRRTKQNLSGGYPIPSTDGLYPLRPRGRRGQGEVGETPRLQAPTSPCPLLRPSLSPLKGGEGNMRTDLRNPA